MEYRTTKPIEWRGHTIPQGTRCKPVPHYPTKAKEEVFVDDLSWLNSREHGFDLHDATHYGIRLTVEAGEVEKV